MTKGLAVTGQFSATVIHNPQINAKGWAALLDEDVQLLVMRQITHAGFELAPLKKPLPTH